MVAAYTLKKHEINKLSVITEFAGSC